ncbi:hypothetical protein L596_025813 [Steinernema carpocapsae]|uniref:BED-type domain-containing protein n=1 Tax=Steinernema carpocapsae TaxID=34508 RepID=A0A4U5M8V0_STECR|nr:hypothetical protein L596_025813 [Steinernema carpocapsae]
MFVSSIMTCPPHNGLRPEAFYNPCPDSGRKRFQTRTALLWNHFQESGKNSVCLHCGSLIKNRLACSMRSHLKRKHPEIAEQLAQEEGSSMLENSYPSFDISNAVKEEPLWETLAASSNSSLSRQSSQNPVSDVLSSEDGDEERSGRRRFQSRTVLLWRHFEDLGKNVACRHCHLVLTGRISSTMRTHLRRRHPEIADQLAEAEGEPQPGEPGSKKPCFGNHSAAFEKLADLFSNTDYSLDLLGNEEFKNFCSTLSSEFEVPSFSSMEECIQERFNEAKQKFAVILKEAKSVAISLDQWATGVAVRAHFIWKAKAELKSILLDVLPSLRPDFERVLNDVGLFKDVLTSITSNSSQYCKNEPSNLRMTCVNEALERIKNSGPGFDSFKRQISQEGKVTISSVFPFLKSQLRTAENFPQDPTLAALTHTIKEQFGYGTSSFDHRYLISTFLDPVFHFAMSPEEINQAEALILEEARTFIFYPALETSNEVLERSLEPTNIPDFCKNLYQPEASTEAPLRILEQLRSELITFKMVRKAARESDPIRFWCSAEQDQSLPNLQKLALKYLAIPAAVKQETSKMEDLEDEISRMRLFLMANKDLLSRL